MTAAAGGLWQTGPSPAAARRGRRRSAAADDTAAPAGGNPSRSLARMARDVARPLWLRLRASEEGGPGRAAGAGVGVGQRSGRREESRKRRRLGEVGSVACCSWELGKVAPVSRSLPAWVWPSVSFRCLAIFASSVSAFLGRGRRNQMEDSGVDA